MRRQKEKEMDGFRKIAALVKLRRIMKEEEQESLQDTEIII